MKHPGILISFSMLLISAALHAQGDKRNFISPSDTALKIDERYNDPYRACYNAGVTVGADGSATSAGVYLDVSGALSLKGFLVRANYAMDISKSDFISSEHPLFSYRKGYSNLQVSGFFNVKDKIEERTMEPQVGFEETGRNSTTISGYSYHVKQNIKYRRTFGIGGSFISYAGNLMYSNESGGEVGFITFVNNANPEHFIVPYTTTVIGIGVQQSSYTSFNYKYQYKGLVPMKFKETFFRTLQYEILFAPTIGYDNMVVTKTGNVVSTLEVQDVKKSPLGVRFFYHSNLYSGKKRGFKPGLYFNGEGGLRPGIYEKTFPQALYMRLGVGFTI